MLSADEQASLRQLLRIAERYRKIAAGLEASVDLCASNQSLKGLDEMVAMNFNAAQFTPQYGGGGGLPANADGSPARYKVVIVDSRPEQVERGGQVVGGYLALELVCVEGPLNGTKHTDRLNIHHQNPKTSEIAQKQLSAYCHILKKYQFNDTSELHNIPFLVDIGLQKEPNPNKYTEVKGIFDLNGNEPGKAGNGPAVQGGGNVNIPDQAAGGVQAQGGGWGGGAPQGGDPNAGQGGNFNGGGNPQGQGGGWNNQQGSNPQGDPNANAGGWNPNGGGAPNGGGNPQGGGWAPNGGGNPQGDPNASQQGGWQQGGNPQGQQGQGGGWQQGGGAPQGGGSPGWGQR